MPGIVPLIVACGIAAAAVLLAFRAARNPGRLWPTLIVALVATSGLVIGGYSIADECVAVVLLLATPRIASMPASLPRVVRWHRAAFTALMIYLLLESVRGVLELQSARKIRWVLFFILILSIASRANRLAGRLPAVRIAELVCKAATAYLVVYVGYAVLARLILDVDRFDLQPGHSAEIYSIWGTTAYVLFTIALLCPAVLVCLKSGGKSARRAAWISWATAGIAAAYYDSRISILCLLTFACAAGITLGLRRFAVFFSSIAVVLAYFIVFIWPSEGRDFSFFLDDLLNSGASLWSSDATGGSVARRDLDRTVHIRVAFTAISDSPAHFLFGHGFRASGYVIGPLVADLYRQYDRTKIFKDIDDMGTETFTDFVVDNGLIGIVLLGANLVLLTYRIWREGEHRTGALLGLAVICAWLFVINVIDVVLFYFAIMPAGILQQMSVSTAARRHWLQPVRFVPRRHILPAAVR